MEQQRWFVFLDQMYHDQNYYKDDSVVLYLVGDDGGMLLWGVDLTQAIIFPTYEAAKFYVTCKKISRAMIDLLPEDRYQE